MGIRTAQGIKLEYRDLGLGKILKAYEELGGTKLRVGVVGPKARQPTADGRLTNAENAVIQMYGLAPDHYESRDFLNGPFIDEQTQTASILRRVAGDVVRLKLTPHQALDLAGYQLEKIATDAILDRKVPPRNAPETIESKGFDHPLVDTLTLVDAISHRIVRGREVLEAGSTVGDDYDVFEIKGG